MPKFIYAVLQPNVVIILLDQFILKISAYQIDQLFLQLFLRFGTYQNSADLHYPERTTEIYFKNCVFLIIQLFKYSISQKQKLLLQDIFVL